MSHEPTGTPEGSESTADRELVMERIFDAPRALVFQAFTDANHLSQWFGPAGWTLPVCKVDLRPGGAWQYCMRGPNGEESWGKAIYQEIVAPERLVYQDNFTDADGNPLEGMPETQVTVEFTEEAGKTKLTSRTLFATPADRDAVLGMGVVEGIQETWDRLDSYLSTVK